MVSQGAVSTIVHKVQAPESIAPRPDVAVTLDGNVDAGILNGYLQGLLGNQEAQIGIQSRQMDLAEGAQKSNQINNYVNAGIGALTAGLGAWAEIEKIGLARDYQDKMVTLAREKNTFDLSMADKQLDAMGQMGDLQVELAEIKSKTEIALAKVEAGKHANEVNARKDVAMVNASFGSYGYGNPSIPTKIYT